MVFFGFFLASFSVPSAVTAGRHQRINCPSSLLLLRMHLTVMGRDAKNWSINSCHFEQSTQFKYSDWNHRERAGGGVDYSRYKGRIGEKNGSETSESSQNLRVTTPKAPKSLQRESRHSESHSRSSQVTKW